MRPPLAICSVPKSGADFQSAAALWSADFQSQNFYKNYYDCFQQLTANFPARRKVPQGNLNSFLEFTYSFKERDFRLMRSEEQNKASRENGAKSQGPVTPEGKERVSQNARKHGLTSPLTLVAEEDEPAYDHLLAAIFQYYNPKGPVESQVIQAVADFEWKLNKANVYEAGIMANGRRENEHLLWEENDPKPEFRFVIIEGVVQQTYSKALTNLSM